MCRARCITHQGRVISATGVHNHAPHMKSPSSNENCVNSNQPPPQPIVINSSATLNPTSISQTIRVVSQPIPSTIHPPSLAQSQPSSTHVLHPNHHSLQSVGSPHIQHLATQPPLVNQQLQTIAGPVQQPTTVIQNMMQNVLTSNNLMHHSHLTTSIHGLTNIGPILPIQHQHHVLTSLNAPPSLQITPVTHIQSPVRTILPPQSHHLAIEPSQAANNHSSMNSTVVVQAHNHSQSIPQTIPQQNENNKNEQSNDNSQAQDSGLNHSQANNQQIATMQTIEMSNSHSQQQNFKLEQNM